MNGVESKITKLERLEHASESYRQMNDWDDQKGREESNGSNFRAIGGRVGELQTNEAENVQLSEPVTLSMFVSFCEKWVGMFVSVESPSSAPPHHNHDFLQYYSLEALVRVLWEGEPSENWYARKPFSMKEIYVRRFEDKDYSVPPPTRLLNATRSDVCVDSFGQMYAMTWVRFVWMTWEQTDDMTWEQTNDMRADKATWELTDDMRADKVEQTKWGEQTDDMRADRWHDMRADRREECELLRASELSTCLCWRARFMCYSVGWVVCAHLELSIRLCWRDGGVWNAENASRLLLAR